jgi:hypothetical protein
MAKTRTPQLRGGESIASMQVSAANLDEAVARVLALLSEAND